MKRSESQSMYNALPGSYITYTNNVKNNKKYEMADKKVLKISNWNVKEIKKDDIYYPKIVSQIIPDFANFYSDTNSKVEIDKCLWNLTKRNEQVYFVEIRNFRDENTNQIIGHIDPKTFYCKKCGKIKFLEDDNDIINMRCDNPICASKGEKLFQYNRIWVCSCGNAFSISKYELDPDKYRYFASVKDGFVTPTGKVEQIKKRCICGNSCTLENATDPKVFFPRIITSIKLTQDADAEICESPEGRDLIIKKQIGEISIDEFKLLKENLKKKDEITIKDIKLEDEFDFFDYINSDNAEKEENITDYDEEVVYKILEYNTLKNGEKIVTSLETAISNAVKYGQVFEKKEIEQILKKLKIENMFSVGNIEIINTAYGYTRKYQSQEGLRKDNEPLKLCSFSSSTAWFDDFDKNKNPGIPVFYNIRTKTEGIVIDVDKKEIYNYLRKCFGNQYNFKDLKEKGLNSWFLNKNYLNINLIKKYQDIDLENGKITNVLTQKVYQLLHTISHMFINTISKFCGIDKSSLSEMIFLNTGSILIYSQTNQGAVLGAITQMFEKDLYNILKSVYHDNKLCTFDPLCIDTSDGSCFACTYLDEVACEHFNKDLSRKLLFGYGEEGTEDYVNNFWEEI